LENKTKRENIYTKRVMLKKRDNNCTKKKKKERKKEKPIKIYEKNREL